MHESTSLTRTKLIGLINEDWSLEYRAGIPDVAYLQTLNSIAGGIREIVRQEQAHQAMRQSAPDLSIA